MIIIVDNVPAHFMVLKASGEAATATEEKSTANKWLGFAKGVAITCMRLSRNTGSWINKTLKLPPSSAETTSTDAGSFQFLMVKCNHKARYCSIIIRAGSSTPHGIFAAYGGTDALYREYQLLVKSKLAAGDDLPTAHFTAEKSAKQGGPIAVTGVVEREENGVVKSATYDVWSVGTNSHGWFPDRFPVGGKLYRNGKEHTFKTITDPLESYPLNTANFSGVGVSKILPFGEIDETKTIKRLLLIAIANQVDWYDPDFYIANEFVSQPGNDPSDTPYGYQGDYLFCYADPPYSELVVAQHLNLGPADPDEYEGDGRIFFRYNVYRRPMIFYFNESGTKASAVYQGSQSDLSYGTDMTAHTTAIWHLNLDSAGETVTPELELNPPKQSSSSFSRTTEEIDARTDFTLTTSISTSSYDASTTAAIGYVGDVEKRLVVHNTNSIYHYDCVPDIAYADWAGLSRDYKERTETTFTVGLTDLVMAETYDTQRQYTQYATTIWSDRVTQRAIILAVDLVSETIWYVENYDRYGGVFPNEATIAKYIKCTDTRGNIYYNGLGTSSVMLDIMHKPDYTNTWAWDVGLVGPDTLSICPQWLAMGPNLDTLACMPYKRLECYSQLPTDLDLAVYSTNDGSGEYRNLESALVTPTAPRLWREAGVF
jgi:hypothetical protein